MLPRIISRPPLGHLTHEEFVRLVETDGGTQLECALAECLRESDAELDLFRVLHEPMQVMEIDAQEIAQILQVCIDNGSDACAANGLRDLLDEFDDVKRFMSDHTLTPANILEILQNAIDAK